MFVCPECHEPAVNDAPTVEGFLGFHWSHLDGEPLCPVMTEEGYAPAPYAVEVEESE